jgi:hypothetical protein
MLGLLRRAKASRPDDPLAPVLTRTVTSARPVTSMAVSVPAFWLGNGCALAGVRSGALIADNAVLESMIDEAGGFDITMAERIELLRWLAIYGPARDENWLVRFMAYLTEALPVALEEALAHEGVRIRDPRFVAGVYVHPVSDCWPVDADVFHAHCLVSGKLWHI